MVVDIRPIKTQEELDEARALLRPGALEPEWINAFVLLEDGKVAGVMCPSVRLVGRSLLLEIEPLHVKRPGVGSLALIMWTDAHLRSIAEYNGLRGYSFTTSNPALQRLCERHLPVTTTGTGTERQYFRIFS